jgi:acetyl-CoA carboxylase biotin carboxyl carrier protein
VDYKAIINLMKEMNHTKLTKLEIEEDGIKICMEKMGNTPAIPFNTVTAMPVQPMLSSVQPEEAVPMNMTVINDTMAASQTTDKQPEDSNCAKIVSPMVGTYYASPSPDKPAFVKVGDKVKKGQTICIIEAMKLMNEIECDHDGEIVKILAENEQMVEFGQPLFLVK